MLYIIHTTQKTGYWYIFIFTYIIAEDIEKPSDQSFEYRVTAKNLSRWVTNTLPAGYEYAMRITAVTTKNLISSIKTTKVTMRKFVQIHTKLLLFIIITVNDVKIHINLALI